MREGDDVPDFRLPDQHGAEQSLYALLANGPVVLFFYPAAMTGGCTKEACHFRDVAEAYAKAGVQRVGISRDTVEKQKQFADQNSFDYPLLSDEAGDVAKLFGVQRGKIGQKLGAPVKRVTYVIGTDHKVTKVLHSEMNMEMHADEALAAAAS